MNKPALATIAAVVVLDRVTKHLIERFIPLDSGMDVIPSCFRLVHFENPGSAFSFFAESTSPWRAPALILISAVALVIIAVLLWKDRAVSTKTIGLALIFGGALGNLWDRLTTGTVTDFLDFYLGTHHWPAFNAADSAIVIGAGLLLLKLFRPEPEGLSARCDR
jgi:signal peptidase II